MSKFIDRLNQASQVVVPPMGFGALKPAVERPKMLLVASSALAAGERLAKYVAGADAVLLPVAKSASTAKTVAEISQVVSPVPWGGWLRGIGKREIKQMETAGCDFVVFPAENTALSTLQNSDMGRILQVEASSGEGLLRAVNELPVDAVLIASEQRGKCFLTWQHLMLCQHFASLLTKPLLVSIPSDATGEELQALWQAGVVGAVVEVGAGQPASGLKGLRKTIGNLTFPLQRRRSRAMPVLPYLGGVSEEGEDLEEEEE